MTAGPLRRLVLDVSCLLKQLSGIGYYTINTVSALRNLRPDLAPPSISLLSCATGYESGA